MLPRLTVEQAVARMRGGGLVVFPTETSFGLGCRALDPGAVEKLVEAKGRPAGKPLPILLPSVEILMSSEMETPLAVLAQRFWPGPLTLVIPAFPGLPAPITASTNMVGVRMSAHPIAQALVAGLGEPVVATSANVTGKPAASSVAECDTSGLTGVDGLIEAEAVAGSASTVVGLVDGDLHIFRAGPIGEDELREVWEAARSRA